MFVAAIDHVYEASTLAWDALLHASGAESAAERLLAFEASHHGEHGLYRIVFAGLSEVDDPKIKEALARMYARYHAFIVARLREHGAKDSGPGAPSAAWALIGLGTIGSVGRELGLLDAQSRARLWKQAGAHLIGPREK